MIIDSHHHFWKYNPVEYDWIDEPMEKIRQDYLPELLSETIQRAGVDGVISVQARQTTEETSWLLDLASRHEFIRGVVGWLPLAGKDIGSFLDHFSGFKKLKGVRHVVQGEPDPDFLLGRDFNRGINLLEQYNLVYDLLVVWKQLPATIRFVDMHPNQSFVLDHIAKPLITSNLLSPWDEYIRELARRENVSCKLSGMVTEADYLGWTPEQLQPYFNTVFEAFGPDRLLFGSDWPVCLVAVSYKSWYDLVLKTISGFSADEQNLIMGDNACRIYHL